MELDNVVVLFAFRYAVGRKGLTLSHMCRYIEKHIDELPNSELKAFDEELIESYDGFSDTSISAFLTAKRLHTSIQRELYGEDAVKDIPEE